MIDYYDEEKWGETILSKDEIFDREKISLKLIKKYSNTEGTMLDVGCGIGFFLNEVKARYPVMKRYGVDYSKYNLKKARTVGVVKRCDLNESIPFKDNFFDLVYIGEVIEHVVDPDKVLRESSRVLKKGGKILITTPNLCSWYNRILVLLGIQPIFYETSTEDPQIGAGIMKYIKKGKIPVGHIRIFTKKALVDQLEHKGFKVVAVKGAHFAALPKNLRWVDDIIKIYPRLASGLVIMAEKQ